MISPGDLQVVQKYVGAGADPAERALAFVRRLWDDDSIEPRELTGSPLDYLKVMAQEHCREGCPGRASCPDGGMRWTVSREEWGRRRVFVVRVGPCQVRADSDRQARAEAIVTASRIPEGMKRCTFANFITDGLEMSARQAKGLAMSCLVDGSSLLLGGGTGVGKTHLAVAMVQELAARGTVAIFVPVVDLLDEIRSGYESGRADEIQRAVRDADCVALDDLGAHKTTEWTSERLFALFDDRYRSGRQTIVTTNACSLMELEGMLGNKGGRITSRLAECAQVHIIRAQDFRARIAQKRLID